jgi:hypothetical protein
MSVTVDFTPRVYFSPELPKVGYIVTNDFWVVLNDDGENDAGGLKFPTVLISGLEKLYVDPDSKTKDYSDFTDNFLKLFSADDASWHALADESVSPPRLKLLYKKDEDTDTPGANGQGVNAPGTEGQGASVQNADGNVPKPSYPVRFTLSTKVAFPRVLDKKTSIDVTIIPDEKKPEEHYTKPLSLMFAPYVCQFGAYVPGSTDPITTLYHGEKCNISWAVKGDTKADVLVRIGDYFTNSQNSCELTVLKDTYCSFLLQSESVNMEYGFSVYRTLLKDTGETSTQLPEPDKRCTNSKIFWGEDNKYYAFFYPSLYVSEDAKSWTVKATDNNANFSSYAVSRYNDRLAICYKSSGNIVYSILDLDDISAGFSQKTISDSSSYTAAFLVLSDDEKPKLLAYGADGAELSVLENGTEIIDTEFLPWDENFKPKSADIYITGNELCMAVLGENGRIYYYNFNDDTKSDLFTDFAEKPNRVTLITAGKHYIVTDTAVICVENDKNTDLHSSLGMNFLPTEKDTYNFYALRREINGYKIFKYGL